MRYLITGGTGSLGSALVMHLVTRGDTERVVVYSRDEVKQGDLAKRVTDPRVRFFLGDVRDVNRLFDACLDVDIVVHTAALKRVDQVSYNPSEVIKTNIFGTMNVLHAATIMDVKKILFISSDKAVHPANIYGATKLTAEFMTIRYNTISYPQGTACAVLRYGNVWGSRGSLLEVFKAQVAARTPLTLTDPAMTRFFVTLPQAVSFVEGALDLMTGGEVFVPKLKAWGLPQVARLFSDQWVYTGKRAGGEKLHEQLIANEEEGRVYDLGWMYVVVPELHEWCEKSMWESGSQAVLTTHYTSDCAERVTDGVLWNALNELGG